MKSVKIIFTSDIHGSVFPTDYTDNAIRHMGLLAIKSSFMKDQNTLVIDGGDTIQGSPFATYLHDEVGNASLMAEVMNHLGYDYVTLGNHDFNYGYDYMMSYLKGLKATVLCANVSDHKQKDRFIKDYTIHTLQNGLKVGLVGLTTDYINVWEQKQNLSHFTVHDTFSVASEVVKSVRSSCDILIGIYHGGFEYDLDSHRCLSTTSENIAYKLCEALPFDLLLTGHQHMNIWDRTIFGTHIVQTPMNGLKYAEINIDSLGKQLDITSRLIEPALSIQDAGIWLNLPETIDQSLYTKLPVIQSQIQTWLDQYVGALDEGLCPDTHLNMALHGNLIANFLNQIQLDLTGADISCTSLANHVLGLDQQVTLRDIVSTYIYPNTQVVLEITGADLMSALERSAAYFELSGQTISISNDFLQPKLAHYNYDYFSGIEYTMDISKPVGWRITSLTFKQQPVTKDHIFKLAMNNYRASGTGGYEFYTKCKVLADIQTTTTDMVIDYIKKHPKVIVDKTKYYQVMYE